MTAAEFLASSDAKAVALYYDELRKQGRLGERAFHLMRTHRNISRIRHYDDAKYIKFLKGRAAFAVGELMDFCGMQKGECEVDKVVVVVPQFERDDAELVQVRFVRDRAGEWKTNKKNEHIITKFCDVVGRGEHDNSK